MSMDNPYDSGLFQHQGGTNYLHLLREVLLTYRQLLKRLSAETGLSGAQFEVLRELALVASGRFTVSGLSRQLGVDPAAVSRVVASLEKLGLVARMTDDRDGRRQPLVLTDQGAQLMMRLHQRVHERESDLTTGLDHESIEAAMRVLSTIRNTLETASRQPTQGSSTQGGSRESR
jgi:DNA-binding MarR family transcriptional regulator